jgi:transcriptional regulator
VTPKPRASDRLEIMQGTLDLIILRTLRWGPMHGHGIVKFIQQTSGDTFKIEHGSLYPALQRLLQERWITAEWGVSTKNRKARFYRLTPAGRRQLSAEHSKWERFSEAISRILTSARTKEAQATEEP